MKFSAEIIFKLGDGLTKQLIVERSEKMKKEPVPNFHVDNVNHLIDGRIDEVDKNKSGRTRNVVFSIVFIPLKLSIFSSTADQQLRQ